jgi:hypothetical protein
MLYFTFVVVCDLNHKLALAAALWFFSEKSTLAIWAEYG